MIQIEWKRCVGDVWLGTTQNEDGREFVVSPEQQPWALLTRRVADEALEQVGSFPTKDLAMTAAAMSIGDTCALYGMGAETLLAMRHLDRWRGDDTRAWNFFRDWSRWCFCGQECEKILKAAKAFIEVTDPIIHDDVWYDALVAMEVICCG